MVDQAVARGVTADAPIRVELLDAAQAGDAALVARLADMVNGAYVTAERGLWREEADRTTADEVAGFVGAGEIAVATRGGEPAGTVRLHDVAPDTSELGMLAVAAGHTGTGVGRALVEFVERRGRARGLRAVRLELLRPRDRRHPSKARLEAWYARRGYRVVGTSTVDAAHPHLAPLLATPCEFAVFEKALRAGA
jgi:ribosomal protein S18 acetylase RimI-like enzyme